MKMDEYKELHDYDDNAEEQHFCNLCGVDYGKLYFFDGEYWCGDCLEDSYYAGEDDEFDETVYCACCGEPIGGKVFDISADGDVNYLCEECFFNAAEFGECE